MVNLFKMSFMALLLSMAISSIGHTEQILPVPKEATIVIAAVHAAASASDYTRLKALMTNEFLWSLGGDRDAEQAIESWKNGVGMMKRLSELTAHIEKCGFVTPEHIQCPTESTAEWRVAFMNTPDGWRMSHFLAGD